MIKSDNLLVMDKLVVLEVEAMAIGWLSDRAAEECDFD
jgi:hypothetical protein